MTAHYWLNDNEIKQEAQLSQTGRTHSVSLKVTQITALIRM